MFVLLISVASAQSLVTFSVADSDAATISLISEVLEDGSSLAEPLVCALPCTVDLRPGIYNLGAERGRNAQYSVTIEFFAGESSVTIPVGLPVHLKPNLSQASCWPTVYIPLVRAFKDEAPLVEGEARAL